MKRVRIGLLLTVVAVLVALVALPAADVSSATPWSEPTLIFKTDGYTSVPQVVADPAGDVHVIFMAADQKIFDPSATGALMYARLHDGRWSAPADVLVSPDRGAAHYPSVALDEQGMLHVVWVGGPLNQIYYSRAHVSEAGQARGWSKPQVLSTRGGFSPSIAAMHDGGLIVVYSADSGVVVARRSDNSGESWDRVIIVADLRQSNTAPNHARVVADDRGRLHVTWSQFQLPSGWPPTANFYARSFDRGETWTVPSRIDGAEYAQVVLVATGDTVHRVWNSIVALGERKHQWSSDGGETWAPAQTIPMAARGGLTGYPAAVLDSARVLHVATSTSSPNGVFHLTWNGKEWSEATLVSTGVIGIRSIEHPSMALGNGNQLHLVFEDDFERIWYTTVRTDAPEIAARPIPGPVQQSLIAPAPSISAALTPTARTAPTIELAGARALASVPEVADWSPHTSGPARPLLAATVATLLLVIGALIGRRIARQWRP